MVMASRSVVASLIVVAGLLWAGRVSVAQKPNPQPKPAPASPAAATVRDDPAHPGVRWARLPAGTFQMGCVPGDNDCEPNETPRHPVTLTRAFELMTTEVSVGMFRAFVAATKYRTSAEREGTGLVFDRKTQRWGEVPGANWSAPGFPQTDAHPVVQVSWDDAVAACKWLGGRLPMEAEWEYAARGGLDGAQFAWGNAALPLVGGRPAANVADESFRREYPMLPRAAFAGYDDGYVYTAPVGMFPPNAFGLFDMGANAGEYTADWLGPYQAGSVTDPRGPSSGKERVVKGVSWYSDPHHVRVSTRLHYSPTHRQTNDGVRCARDVTR